MPVPKYLVLDGKRYAWRDILELRRAQRREAAPAQLVLFELKYDARHSAERSAAGRYLEPSLFSALNGEGP